MVESGLRVPVGLVLHIAPANVDTMFVLSWALSFLAGNANLVRLSTRSNPVMQDLLECIEQVFASAGEAVSGNLFLTYEHSDEITAALSLACDLRIIWGGDETVRRIRSAPLSPHAADRAFASKRSLSVVGAGAYLALASQARDAAAGRMATDLAPFGQMACSSPHILYWLGNDVIGKEAARDFGQRLEQAMGKRGGADLGGAVRRITHAFAAAAEGRAVAIQHAANTTLVSAYSSRTAEPADLCGAGLLTQVEGTTISEVVGVLRGDHQTITYLGLSEGEKAELAAQAGRAGIDRIVPLGRALDFGPKWDGYDLWSDLTHWVVVE